MSDKSAVDQYFDELQLWRSEMLAMRSILQGLPLDEQLKWRSPCYSFQKKNVVIIGGLKDSCTLSFFQGALLKDRKKILDVPGKNTQSARLIRFTDVDQILDLKKTIVEYVAEAIELVKQGAKVPTPAKDTLELPKELLSCLKQDPELANAFEQLTPGRKRGYVLHINQAKQSGTRTGRIEKCRPRILAGKGINDCICGLSKRMPNCDGSHKQL